MIDLVIALHVPSIAEVAARVAATPRVAAGHAAASVHAVASVPGATSVHGGAPSAPWPAPVPHWAILLVAVPLCWLVVAVGVVAVDRLFDRFDP